MVITVMDEGGQKKYWRILTSHISCISSPIVFNFATYCGYKKIKINSTINDTSKAYYKSQFVDMEYTDKESLDHIDGGIIHHVREKGNHPQYKTRVNFAVVEGQEGRRERERDEKIAPSYTTN